MNPSGEEEGRPKKVEMNGINMDMDKDKRTHTCDHNRRYNIYTHMTVHDFSIWMLISSSILLKLIKVYKNYFERNHLQLEWQHC